MIFELDAQLDGIRRGDLARVELERTVDEPGFWLPVQSLTEGVRGLWSVYTIEASSIASEPAVIRRHDVEILHPQTDRVYVRSALTDRSRVVVGGLHRLAPGMAVRPAEKPSPALINAEADTP